MSEAYSTPLPGRPSTPAVGARCGSPVIAFWCRDPNPTVPRFSYYFAGLVLLTVAGCGGSGPTPAASVAPAHIPPLAGSAAVSPRGADATLGYWNGLNHLCAQITPHMKDGPKAQVGTFREAAGVIRQNPTLGIDADLVAWALRMADLMEQRADLIEQSRSPALLVEAFARGMTGDPFGAAIELSQAERRWVAAWKAHLQAWHRIRATLTARYGVQFN